MPKRKGGAEFLTLLSRVMSKGPTNEDEGGAGVGAKIRTEERDRQ